MLNLDFTKFSSFLLKATKKKMKDNNEDKDRLNIYRCLSFLRRKKQYKKTKNVSKV